MMTGLGIDFGPPEPMHSSQAQPHAQHDGQPRARTRTMSHGKRQAPPSAHSAHTQGRRVPGHGPRPSTAGATLSSPQRRVRIASGQPGVMGTGAGHTTDEDIFSSPEDSNNRPSFSSASIHQLTDPRVNPRMAVTVANAPSVSDSSSPNDSLFSGSSPGTDTSATSYTSSAGAPKRALTLRKLASQPNLASRPAVAAKQAPGPPPPSTISRCRSSNNLSGKARGTGASLGRSSEIRSGSRQTSLRGGRTNSSRGRGGGAPTRGRDSMHTRTQSWDGGPIPILHGRGQRQQASSNDAEAPAPAPAPAPSVAPSESPTVHQTPNEQGLIPDGFGGYKHPDDDASSQQAKSQGIPSPIEEASPDLSARGGPAQNAEPTAEPVQFPSKHSSPAKPTPSPSAQSQPSTVIQQARPRRTRAHSAVESHVSLSSTSSYTAGSHPRGPLQVGAFYNECGLEAARLDLDGRLAQDRRARVSRAQTADSRASEHAANGSQPSPVRLRARANSTVPTAVHMRGPAASTHGGDEAADAPTHQRQGGDVVRMRSLRGFRGLEAAEHGGAMVSLDGSNAFDRGEVIVPGVTNFNDEDSIINSAHLDAQADSSWHANARSQHSLVDELSGNAPPSQRLLHSRSAGHLRSLAHSRSRSEVDVNSAATLDRNGTLLNPSGNPARRSRDLQRLLGNSSRKALASAGSDSERSTRPSCPQKGSGLQRSDTTSTQGAPQAVLEKGRSNKARVDVDVLLESDLVVEGGLLKGRLEVKIRKQNDGEGSVLIAHPKVRVVGFEELLNDDTRHIFYHHATLVDGDRHPGGSQPFVLHGSPTLSSPEAEGRAPLPCFASQPDHEGYSVGREGAHSIPFSLEMPIGKGAKGSYRGKNALVRYIVIGSVKLKDPNGENRSIAHFYRHVELFPYLNPAIVLSSAPRAIQATGEKGLFLGGSGKVRVTASLHRGTWVAGQRVYVNVAVQNETSKRVKNVTFTLIRTVTLYRPRPELELRSAGAGGYIDPDACTTSTSRKKVTEEVLEMGQKGSKGVVTAKGWWTGVEAGTHLDFSHHLTIPADALTIARGRHVEVAYVIRVSVGSSLSSDVSVELPLRIINFMSLDPPPLKGINAKSAAGTAPRGWTASPAGTRSSVSGDEAPMIAMVKSAEALRSPSRVDIGRGEPHLPSGPPSHLLQLSQRAAERHGLRPPEDPARRMQHQKSLDFINHAIRSATARRNSNQKPGEEAPMGLGIDVPEGGESHPDEDDDEATPTGSTVSSFSGPGSERGYSSASSGGGRRRQRSPAEAVHPSCQPYEHIDVPAPSFGFPFVQLPAVSVDDAADDSDDEDADRTLGLNQDSVDEVDMVVGSARLEGEASPGFRQLPTSGDAEESMDADASVETVRDEGDGEPGEELSRPAADGLRPAVVVDSPEKAEPVSQRSRRQSVAAARQSLAHQQATARGTPTGGPAAKRSTENLRQRGSNASLRSSASSTSLPPNKKATGGVSPGSEPRPLPASKDLPSPTKPALKNKSSFTFATSTAPLRVAKAGTTEPKKEAPRAKAAQSQFADAGAEATKAVTTPSSTSSSPRKSRPLPKEPTMAAASARQSPRKSHVQAGCRGPQSNCAHADDDGSDSSSPASVNEALTPESAQGDFQEAPGMHTVDYGHPGGLVLVLEEPTAAFGKGALPPKRASVVGGGALGGTAPRARREMSAEPEPQGARAEPRTGIQRTKTIRHSNSTASLTGERLQRSHSGLSNASTASMQNIRGSSVVVPSVRNKIAMLESRQQALREFTRPASGSYATGGGADSPSCSSTSTPRRMGSSNNLRVGGAAAGRDKDGAAGAGRGGLAAPGGDARRQTGAGLGRKDSNLSLHSDVSSATTSTAAAGAQPWMRRDSFSSNVASFKAPLLQREGKTAPRRPPVPSIHRTPAPF